MLTIKVDTDNDAFYDDEGENNLREETVRILRNLANRIESGEDFSESSRTILDRNGNGVGGVRLDREVHE